MANSIALGHVKAERIYDDLVEQITDTLYDRLPAEDRAIRGVEDVLFDRVSDYVGANILPDLQDIKITYQED